MREHRRALAFLGMQQIERMLALPEGLRAIACRDDFQRNGVAVLVEGDALEPQPEACVLPDLPLTMSDPSALARRASVRGWQADDGDHLDVFCPMGCAWNEDIHGMVSLALIADVVQQHLIEAHDLAGEATS